MPPEQATRGRAGRRTRTLLVLFGLSALDGCVRYLAILLHVLD